MANDNMITEKTITLNIKTFWAVITSLIIYSITVAGLYFTLQARVLNNEKKITQHDQAVNELGLLKADVREIKVRMEAFPEIKRDMKEIDKKLDELIRQLR